MGLAWGMRLVQSLQEQKAMAMLMQVQRRRMLVTAQTKK